MKLQDAFRAQYFLSTLERERRRAEKYISSLKGFPLLKETAFDHLSTQLSLELDRMLLPSVVLELNEAKNSGFLKGASAEERYNSFFVDAGTFSRSMKKIPEKYPHLFLIIEKIIRDTFDAVCFCLKRYCKDVDDIVSRFSLSTKIIDSIELLEGADRHRGQSSFLITFADSRKIIYKPVDLGPDLLLHDFAMKVGFEEELSLKFPDTFAKIGYGWIRYIQRSQCQAEAEIHHFYRRMGTLLAISEALNYTDGHCENLIADGPYPILIDCETLFQNYEPAVSRNKNILSTLLIQKITNEKDQYFISALQAPGHKKVECLKPYTVNDHSDKIQIHYFGLSNSPLQHSPNLFGISCNAYDYVSDIIEGFSRAYRHISSKTDEILSDSLWWDKLSSVRSRIVLRETISYVYLLRKILQPEFIATKESAEMYLSETLGHTAFAAYEIEEILSCNIPYFYQYPGRRHLYDGNENEYPNVFSETAEERLKAQFLERSEDKMFFNCEILSRHLIPYEVKEGALG